MSPSRHLPIRPFRCYDCPVPFSCFSIANPNSPGPSEREGPRPVPRYEYFWGLDMSGAEQGAGGVSGLLAVSMDGVFYLPCYDHNGNIVRYASESGATAAAYVYDPYGNVVEATGLLAEQFTFDFSTKVHDRKLGLVAYQRRFLCPAIGRWINREMVFYACDSDSDIGYGRWRDHVAINAGGIYVGYSGLAFAWTHSEDGHDEQK